MEIREFTQDELLISESDGLVYALYLFAPTLEMAKEALAQGIEEGKASLPFAYKLPCGNIFTLNSLDELTGDDVYCPCGNEKHWFVYNDIGPQWDMREKEAQP
jgi:hypothetical protein